MMTTDFVLCAVTIGLIIISIVLRYKEKKRKNLPPGPIAWPVIGNLFEIGSRGYDSAEKMRAKYGDVFQVHIGSKPVVIVCGKAVEQCLNKNSVAYSMRPDLFMSRNILDGKSIAFSNMPVEVHRRYKKVGIAELRRVVNSNKEKSCCGDLENVMYHEAKQLGNKLVELSNKPRLTLKERSDEMCDFILYTACNTASSFIYGKRSKIGDRRSMKMMKLFKNADNIATVVFEFFPFLQNIFPHKAIKAIAELKEMKQFLQGELEEYRRNNFHERETCLLGRIKEFWNEQDPSDTDYEEDYLMNLNSDFFGAAVDTTRISFQWLIMYAATYQEVQEKLRNEINKFRKTYDRYPTFSERSEFPYMMSYFSEVIRHSCILPLTPSHCTVHDTNLSGYSIPRGTIVLASFWSLNKSEEFWDRPELFRPTRFISDEGIFDAKLAEKVAAFGSGRRRCPGEFLAHLEAFVFMNVLFHKFKFERTGNNKSELPDRKSAALSVRPEMMDIKATCLSNMNGAVCC